MQFLTGGTVHFLCLAFFEGFLNGSFPFWAVEKPFPPLLPFYLLLLFYLLKIDSLDF